MANPSWLPRQLQALIQNPTSKLATKGTQITNEVPVLRTTGRKAASNFSFRQHS
jgi:hypothetical protein